MSARAVLTLAGTLALAAAMALFVAARLEWTTAVTHFLSVPSERALASVSAQLADSALTRSLILSLTAPDPETAATAARDWKRVLASHPEVASIRSGPDQDFARAVYELYFPRRFMFQSGNPERELPERFSQAGLRRAAGELRSALSGPGGQLSKQLAPADPLQSFAALLQRFEAARTRELEVISGQFVSGKSAILFLTTEHSAFETQHQEPFGEFLERSFGELDARYRGSLELERSGVHRFAVASERRARLEMASISTLSIGGIVVLFLLIFRSLWGLAVALLPLCMGLLVATTVSMLAFGTLHVLTFVFGSTLIGVCIDYPVHYLNHYTLLGTPSGPRASLRRVLAGLLLGALTTVAGFSGLAGSNFPGVREIGVFAGVGVLAALAVTCLVIPELLPGNPRTSLAQQASARFLGRLLTGMDRQRRALLAIPLAAGVVCAVGLPRLEWQDDVFDLGAALNRDWLDEDARVRSRVSRMDAGRVVVIQGNDEEELLLRNEVVGERLEMLRSEGVLAGFSSLRTFLYSAALQERNLRALNAIPELPLRVDQVFVSAGFTPDAFVPFAEALRADPPAPLRLSELRDSPLAQLAAPFEIEVDGAPALLTFLEGVRDPTALSAALSGLQGVQYFDQQRFLADAFGRYRERSSRLIGIGVIAVLALLFLRYRRVGLVAVAALPSLLAAGTTLAVLALAGIPVSLLHLLGLLLVLGMGVDYGVFLLESRADSEQRACTFLSVTLACVSTCLAFGLLAGSSFPALAALGITTGIGVILSLVFAPTVLVLSASSGS